MLSGDASDIERLQGEVAMLRQEVQNRTELAEAASKELEAFVYSVSHDLRGPLRHISGYVHILGEDADYLREEDREYLNSITQAVQKMDRLIDGLLRFSRASRTELQKTTVDMNAVVSDVVKVWHLESDGRNIEWKVGELGSVYADQAMMRAVVETLISNAFKFSSRRDQTVIEVGTLDNEPGQRCIFVRDNGVGFDQAHSGKLFEVFQRLHSDREFPGIGISLAVARRIVERHEGRVWAEGVLNEGATFYFCLPTASSD